MEVQIHLIEQEAYFAVLRAFKAQSDAITWEKEGLITELRKELRVSDDEHRELLNRVHTDDTIKRIRDWRQGGGNQPARHVASQPLHDILPSPTLSASRKKQKTFQSYPSSGPTGTRQFVNRVPSVTEPPESIVGRKVWTRWPEDNSFYEAVITEYNADEGRYALVYDIHTVNETWEWVDFREIPPEDIRWDGEEASLSYMGSHGRSVRGSKKSFSHAASLPSGGRGRGLTKSHSRRDTMSLQNGGGKKLSDDIELLNTEALVKEVEKVFDASRPDPMELEKAKRMLKDHEQALIDAIARLADASDGESDGEQPFSHAISMPRG